MSESETTVKFGPVDNDVGEIAVEAHFWEDGADGRSLNAFALLEGEIRGYKTINKAGEPGMPEDRVGFDAGKK